VNRRFFLFTAGSAAISGQTPSPKQVTVGIIGVGFRGRQLLEACLALPGVQIGAVCETYEQRMFGAGFLARAKGHRARYYRIYSDLIADGDLDAVIVATPDFWHHRMTLEALRAGKDVYVEQPLCLSWQEGVELLEAEKNSRQIVQVGSQRRSSPLYTETAARIAEGAVGHVQMAQAECASAYLRAGVFRRGGVKFRDPLNFPDWQAAAATKVPYSPDRFLNWRFYSMYGGGPVTDLGVHALDGVHILTGASFPSRVQASGIRSKEEGFDTVERAALVVTYPNGLLTTLSVNGIASKPHENLIIDGERGRIEIIPQGSRGPVLRPGAEPPLGDATRRHLANFFECVRSRNKPNAPISLTFPATLICQMGNVSIGAGLPVRWDGTKNRVQG
jgi:predicted dehydrogenase